MNRFALPLFYAALAAGAYMIGGWPGVVVFLAAMLMLGAILSLVVTLLQARSANALPFHRRFANNFGKAMMAIPPLLP